MKKIVISILIVIFCLTLFACTKPPAEDPVAKNISYTMDSLVSGQNDNFAVSFSSGKSEKEPVLDGICSELENFNKVSLMPLNFSAFNKEYSFTLSGDQGELNGTFTKDRFGNGYNAVLQDITPVGKIVSIAIKNGDNSETIELVNRMENAISAQEALDIAKREFNEGITTALESGELGREIIIKYINDNRNVNSMHYWYISFYKNDKDYWCVLIDPLKGTVLTKKS